MWCLSLHISTLLKANRYYSAKVGCFSRQKIDGVLIFDERDKDPKGPKHDGKVLDQQNVGEYLER